MTASRLVTLVTLLPVTVAIVSGIPEIGGSGSDVHNV
jgi:hypothetical protein